MNDPHTPDRRNEGRAKLGGAVMVCVLMWLILAVRTGALPDTAAAVWAVRILAFPVWLLQELVFVYNPPEFSTPYSGAIYRHGDPSTMLAVAYWVGLGLCGVLYRFVIFRALSRLDRRRP